LVELGIPTQPFDAEAPGPLGWPERLDGLVYCPGTITLKSFGRLTADDFLRDLRVNLLGAVASLQSAHPALRASGSASVVLNAILWTAKAEVPAAGVPSKVTEEELKANLDKKR
jgi:NAD(P)-dependent dehydrogenase (short-subunit alcohol dehydrogenase family)